MSVLSSSRSFDYRNIIWMVRNETVLTQTATRYEVTGLGPSGQTIAMLVTGTGFTYTNGSLTGGFSQTLVVTLNGQPYFQMTGTRYDLNNDYFDNTH